MARLNAVLAARRGEGTGWPSLTASGGDQRGQLWQGVLTELPVDQPPVLLERPSSLAAVSLGEMCLDERPLRAFSQGFHPNGEQGRIDCLGETTRFGEVCAEGVEGVKHSLAQPFTLEDDPLVVPTRQ